MRERAKIYSATGSAWRCCLQAIVLAAGLLAMPAATAVPIVAVDALLLPPRVDVPADMESLDLIGAQLDGLASWALSLRGSAERGIDELDEIYALIAEQQAMRGARAAAAARTALERPSGPASTATVAMRQNLLKDAILAFDGGAEFIESFKLLKEDIKAALFGTGLADGHPDPSYRRVQRFDGREVLIREGFVNTQAQYALIGSLDDDLAWWRTLRKAIAALFENPWMLAAILFAVVAIRALVAVATDER